MKIRYAVALLAFGLIVAFAVHYIAALGVAIGPPKDRINVSMQVSDINGLVVDSNVLFRGVPVGKITKIQASIDNATINFYVDKKFSIPVDSDVRLENLSALGESYIGFMPRSTSGPMLYDGQQIAAKDIKQPASISELTTNVVRVLNQMDPATVARLVNGVDRALPNPDGVLPNLARASRLLKNMVMTMNGRGSETLANFQTLLQNAGWVGPTLAEITPSLMQTGQPLLDEFKVGVHFFGSLGAPEAMRQIADLFDRFQKFLDDRAPDLKVIAQALAPNVQGIAASLMNIDASQILSNTLDAFPEDGTITLHVTVPNP